MVGPKHAHVVGEYLGHCGGCARDVAGLAPPVRQIGSSDERVGVIRAENAQRRLMQLSPVDDRNSDEARLPQAAASTH
jgi:hypothetical protein